MSQHWGISLRYHQCEATWAAIQLAELAREAGIHVRLYADDVCNRELSPYWDAHVTDGRKVPFDEWMMGCTRVIWTTPPSQLCLDRVQHRGIETQLLADWELIQEEDADVVARLDSMILPHRCVAEAMCRWASMIDGHFYPYLLPWDVQLPITKPQKFREPEMVYMPLHDSQAAKITLMVFNVLHAILTHMPKVSVTLTGGARWSLKSLRAVNALRRHHGSRIQFIRKPDACRRLQLLTEADVMLWPACYENFGIIGLEAITMGVPVLAWEIPPMTEFLRHNHNAVLVPCDVQYNWLGVPCVHPDYDAFGRAALSLLQNPQLLATIRATSRKGLQARKDQFMQMWTKLTS